MLIDKKPNRLAREKSPYLLQHAYNPVDWFPWSEEAFEKAQQENKPVFLSIGYSTCHWCHVMEQESFEDPEVAELLNRHFVAIKVDREERPDVDHLYMAVCQALTGQGGWPLTVFLTPEKEPFFAGTYFPKRSRYGRPGLMELLGRVAELWEKRADRVRDAGRHLVGQIGEALERAAQGEVEAGTLTRAFEQLLSTYDHTFGGFGQAPKFPRPHDLLFLLRYGVRSGRREAFDMVQGTLEGMRRGGIWDHVGFGFARYSTDRRWLIPHFEKMLYDNALLALAHLEAYQALGDPRWAETAREIFLYVRREMTDPAGGFYSAEDADSEGEEGKFYVWTPREIAEAVGSEDGEVLCRYFGVTEEGNFEGGRSVLNKIDTDEDFLAREMGMTPEEMERKVRRGLEVLRAVRDRRVHPHKDDKILTAWNGLMIAALARGARVLGDADYLVSARRAAEWIWRTLRQGDGRLLARYRDGEAGILGYLDDYAFYIWGLLELYQADGDVVWLRRAIRLAQDVRTLFWDEKEGGCFLTGSDAEALWSRPKTAEDGALPSGNSVLALDLLWLGRLTGDPSWERWAEEELRAFAGVVSRYPAGYTFFLTAWDFALGPSEEIVVAEPVRNEEGASGEGFAGVPQAQGSFAAARWPAEVRRLYLPRALWVVRPDGAEGDRVAEVLPWVSGHRSKDGRAQVYICRGNACERPLPWGHAAARLQSIGSGFVDE
ncbi:MAG: thioredoxin domain-containing protein [Kyrpidia tusciae]|nr:thioredoxin domain-containing protein [Kyrpidia tusciae]MBE3553289.1 thioredoxin domain-containing protein [Kyrpidia tusciae]